jgi:hypothetical protein
MVMDEMRKHKRYNRRHVLPVLLDSSSVMEVIIYVIMLILVVTFYRDTMNDMEYVKAAIRL